MSALKTKSNTRAFADMLADSGDGAIVAKAKLLTAAPKTSNLLEGAFLGVVVAASLGFCVLTIAIAVEDPDYFARKLIASFQKRDLDPIETGSTGASGEGAAPAAPSLPVPIIERAHEPTPQDYQIIMVFEDEAILATSDELVRVKVGSTVPGLGKITDIQTTDTGGSVVAEDATLKSVLK